ncbi:MAG: hypothetical protein HY841_12955 [Bacteroidetes bacterium]|nr:hypothetical protein [Bacteroidota bacterium]
MKKKITSVALLKNKSKALGKCSAQTDEFFEAVCNSIIKIIDKYFPPHNKHKLELVAFMFRTNCHVIDIAIETEKAYLLLKRMHKEKDKKKKDALYETYRVKTVKFLLFGRLVLRFGKIAGKKKRWLNFLLDCDKLIEQKLKKYFPLLRQRHSKEMLAYGLFVWRTCMEIGIDAAAWTRIKLK